MQAEQVHTEKAGFWRRLWRDAFGPIGDAEGFYRHRALVRLTHWINALCILFLLGTGLNIFNAHPRLYWGPMARDADQPFFSHGRGGHARRARRASPRSGPGTSTPPAFWAGRKWMANIQARGWPDWLTIPSFQDLADARHWHFLFAWILVVNGLVYLGWSLWRATSSETSGRHGPISGPFRARSWIISGSSIPPAKPPSATMCCRGWPIWA